LLPLLVLGADGAGQNVRSEDTPVAVAVQRPKRREREQCSPAHTVRQEDPPLAGAEDVVLISASELAGLQETAHLLSSPKNAERLLTALNRARERTVAPESVAALRRELGVDRED